MKRVFRLILFLSFGYLLGKSHSDRLHEKDTDKIINASYLDDDKKVRLLKDLRGKQAGSRKAMISKRQKKVSRRQLLKSSLKSAARKIRALRPFLPLKK